MHQCSGLIGKIKVDRVEFDDTVADMTGIVGIKAMDNSGHNNKEITRIKHIRFIVAFHGYLSVIHIQQLYIIVPMCPVGYTVQITVKHKYIIGGIKFFGIFKKSQVANLLIVINVI
ncbi:hypothetical protein GCWU000282_01033 [Catonella morbi ATCC 51271]|uniref:Uncharacterized protein n=1 Tax=Catonella morbi ATCC 51271 TaxID=592026 RepID=V2Y854_9FIRM|nr:hypothetical protein GCWU000282_01033 [Catonella morbi ATCC 51271]